jgi:hypothetical protein
LPDRLWNQINALKNKIRAGDQQRSGVGQTPGRGLSDGRPDGSDRHGIVYVKLPLATEIE